MKRKKILNRKDVILTVETCFLGISTFIPYARALKYIHELSTFFDGVGFLKNLLFLENIWCESYYNSVFKHLIKNEFLCNFPQLKLLRSRTAILVSALTTRQLFIHCVDEREIYIQHFQLKNHLWNEFWVHRSKSS